MDIIQLIKHSRTNAIRAVNAELLNLLWNIGEYISKKIEQAEWGDSVVSDPYRFVFIRWQSLLFVKYYKGL